METIARGELKPIAPDTIYYPHKMRIGCGKLKVMIGYSPRESDSRFICNQKWYRRM